MTKIEFYEDTIKLFKEKYNIHIYQFIDEGDIFWVYIENKNKNELTKIKSSLKHLENSYRKAIFLTLKNLK